MATALGNLLFTSKMSELCLFLMSSAELSAPGNVLYAHAAEPHPLQFIMFALRAFRARLDGRNQALIVIL